MGTRARASRLLVATLFVFTLASAATDRSFDLALSGADTWTAANASQGYRLTLSAGGASVVTRKGAFTMSLRRDDGAPMASGPRLDVLHNDLDESFVNDRSGLLYGIRLIDGDAHGTTVLAYAFGGDLRPKLRDDGREIALSRVLVLGDLRAADAEGRDVDLAWRDGTKLVVQTQDHVFPVTISMRLTTAKSAEPAASPAGPLVVPPNDQCTGAEVIPAAGPFPYTSGAYDITDATSTGDPALPSCQSDVSRSIWFKFTPSASGNFTFATCSDAPSATTVPDTVLAVYAATGSCTGLSEVTGGCDDDSCVSGSQQSVISAIRLTAGQTYYVVAWQFSSTPPSPGASTIQLVVSQNSSGSAPPNDQCGGAEVIPAAGPFPYTTALTADITNATETGDPAAPSCQPLVSRSIWYVFTPSASGNYTFSSCADAPTGTTVDDTVIAVYSSAGVCSALNEVAGGCDDDSCGVEDAQAVVSGLPLVAGQTYYVVVWKYDTIAPTVGNTAVQLRVDKGTGPSNDFCSGAIPLALDTPLAGTTLNTTDDYELSGTACFTGIGQTPMSAVGGDAVYRYAAAVAGSYSFRVNAYDPTKNVILYVASDCPGGTSPATIGSCLAAANRNSGNPAEEVNCLPLTAGQNVYVYVDEAVAGGGSTFNLEVNRCTPEAEPDDSVATASTLACGVEGGIGVNGDADFFSLGAPDSGSRVFAIADGVAASSTDFDMRVTTATDTLEFDDANDDTPFGALSPNVAGTPLTGVPGYLRLSLHSAIMTSEPYRLYAAIQPPSSSATPEVEPNGTTAAATAGTNLYWSGSLSSTSDVDIFKFTATAGDLVSIGLDADPARDNTPFNAILALLDSGGAALVTVNDSGATSSTTSGAGTLTATTPNSPGEALTYRIRTSGTYYARVTYSSGTTPADYLLSVARNCKISPATDVSVTQSDSPDPAALGASVTYTITVHDLGAAPASVIELRDDLPAGSSFVSATPSHGTCNGTGPVFCHLGTLAASGTATVALVVTAPNANATMVNTARVQTAVIDTNAANDTSTESTTVGAADSDGDGVPDTSDCAPNNAAAWAIPGEATALIFPTAGNKASMQWTAPAIPGGTTVLYDLVRATAPGGFATPSCLATGISATSASDPASPAAGFYYLVRSENVCGGNVGTGVNGAPRTVGSCP
ncbi:MAG TPA: DUF11 domain-containing protein [Candidatus Polarisedimenticolaceae bacterium]|nr:DUF11 domain-containing protein [Candidatus Polarisedimenticolaceae bacterium]